MYNLLMTGGSGNWNNPTWVMGIDRLFEYTHDAFKARFDSMSDEVVSELMSLPTLFAYERGVQEPARVGRITHCVIQKSQSCSEARGAGKLRELRCWGL